MENHEERVMSSLSEIKGDIKDILNCIHGNGHPGLKTLVDRHERGFKVAVWIIAPVYIAIVAFIANSIL